MIEQKKHSESIKKIFTPSNIFIFLGTLLIFFIALRPPTDPDMGWHLKDGEYLLAHNLRVAHSDIFSYTMTDFPLIMHEWITDSWMYLTYRLTGLFSLSIIFALITAAAFIFAAFGSRAKREYRMIAAILGTIASIPVLGVRPQMLNLLGLAFIVFTIFRYRENPKTKLVYFFPPIFIFWVNMHAGFAVGLFFIGLFLGLEAVKRLLANIFGKFSLKKIMKISAEWLDKNTLKEQAIFSLGLFFLLSVIATLVNPYGWRVYVEIITTIFDSYAKANIGEWTAVSAANPMSYQFIIYLILLGILLLMSFKTIDYTYLFISGVFLYLAFSSWRHMPIFLIISTPLWVSIVESLAGLELLKLVRRKWFLALIILALAITAQQQIKRVYPISNSIDLLAKDGNYPLGAVRYLKENPISGNMFNEYNWGGFLIWQYPEKKVFIDGRMPSWRIGNERVFEEFNNTMSYNDGWDKTFEKYEVKFALIYNNPINNIAFESIGWKRLYQDDLSVIYEKE